MATFHLRDFACFPVKIASFHRQLGPLEQASPAARRALTQDRLARLLHHAVANVPYYRRTLAPFRGRFDAMVDRLDISELPVLTKRDIRRAGTAALCADNLAAYRASKVCTSGTTGTPMAFYLGADSHVAHFASIWRMLNWTGYRFGNRFADLSGMTLRGDAEAQVDRRLNCLRLCSYHLSRDTVARFNDRLARFRPYFLKATPSSLFLYARFLEETGVTPHQPPVILTCAETVHPHYRETFRRVFTGRHFDFYNQNERACLFSTCEHGAYHIHEDYAFVELVGAAGAPAHILATTFHNPAMPLIRYQTNDLAIRSEAAPCACGRTHRTVERIKGRADDVVVTPEGGFCSSFEYLFEEVPGLRFAQIYQEDVSAIDVRLVINSYFDRINEPLRLEREMRRLLGSTIGITFSYPASISPGRTGKMQFVVSRPGRQLTHTQVGDKPLESRATPASVPLEI